MKCLMKSWLRPSNRSASVNLPCGPSKTYCFSILTQGSVRRAAANSSRSRVSSFSLAKSALRASSHSARETIFGLFMVFSSLALWSNRPAQDRHWPASGPSKNPGRSGPEACLGQLRCPYRPRGFSDTRNFSDTHRVLRPGTQHLKKRGSPKMRWVAAVALLLALASGASGSPAGSWPTVLASRESYSPDVSAAVERVWSDPTLSRTVKGRAALVPLDVYAAFLDAPDVTAAAARHRGFAKYEIRAIDDNRYVASDGDSAHGSAEVLQRQPRRVVVLSRGEHTGPFLGTISGSALTIIDLEPQRRGVNPTLVAYVYID